MQACRIAKLFAKHMKVPEQQQYLQQHPVCIAAGTPNRLCKLADLEALQLHQLKLVIVDVHQDAKQRCGGADCFDCIHDHQGISVDQGLKVHDCVSNTDVPKSCYNLSCNRLCSKERRQHCAQ